MTTPRKETDRAASFRRLRETLSEVQDIIASEEASWVPRGETPKPTKQQ